MLLETKGLSKSFGGLKALDNFSLTVEAGRVVSLIGPNGAGKTTLFNLLTGVYKPDAGEVHFDGRTTAGLAPHELVSRGIARTFQNIRLFPEMTVMENVMVGRHCRSESELVAALLRSRGHYREEAEIESASLEALDFVGLRAAGNEVARNLAYGLQRRVEIARAMATGPRMLLLDEPTAGMNPTEAVDMMRLIGRIRDAGMTVLLIEHRMQVVMNISDRVAVLDYGEKIADGSPAQVRNDPNVIEAYLGKSHAAD